MLNIVPVWKPLPQIYDLGRGGCHHRFQSSTEFVDLVGRTVGQNEAVLDLAAGTGDVSRELQKRGYQNISLADRSEGMLRIAKRKLGENVSTYVTSMRNMNLGKSYDAIIVRQAINYLMDYEGLVDGFRAMHVHLNEGGRLVFNAPNFNEGSEYKERSLEYEHGDYYVKVRELNLNEGRMIIHTQHCVLTKKDGSEIKKVYDLNRFGVFTKDEFGHALREAGFESVQFLGKGLRDCVQGSKTLYCVAKK